MNRNWCNFLRRFVLILFFWSASFGCLADDAKLSIVFAADMPVIGQQGSGSYASLATAVKQYRESNALFLFGGNSIGPSPMSSFDSGSHIIDLLNGIGPDAMGVTKREYSYFEEQLSLRAFEAAFPLIATNVFDPLQDAVQDGLIKSMLIPKGEITLGIMAVVAPSAKEKYLLKRVIIQDIASSVRAESKRLRAKGANFIIVMQGSIFPEIDELLQKGVINLTLIKDLFAPEKVISKSLKIPNKVLISGADDIAVVDIFKNENDQFSIEWQRESLTNYAADPEIEKNETDYLRRLDRLMLLPIAEIKTPFNTFRRQVRTQENKFANLITDSMIAFTGADVAIINSGVIRGDREYAANYVFTRKDLIEELPFRTGVVTVEMTGSDILKTLENGLTDFPLLEGKFPQVGNMTVVFDGKRPPGNRIMSIQIGEYPIESKKYYKVATTDYLYNGGDGYTYFGKSRVLANPYGASIMLADLVLTAILKNTTLSLTKQGRITNVQMQNKGQN